MQGKDASEETPGIPEKFPGSGRVEPEEAAV